MAHVYDGAANENRKTGTVQPRSVAIFVITISFCFKCLSFRIWKYKHMPCYCWKITIRHSSITQQTNKYIHTANLTTTNVCPAPDLTKKMRKKKKANGRSKNSMRPKKRMKHVNVR